MQAPVILSQSDLQERVTEVLEAVKKDQAASGSASAMPQIVLVCSSSGEVQICIRTFLAIAHTIVNSSRLL